MNAEMPRERCPGSVRASTPAIPPTDALVMKALLPFRTPSPSRHSARVRRAAASEPEPGSVSPQAPSTSPEARRGRYRRFCASEPNVAMWFVHSEKRQVPPLLRLGAERRDVVRAQRVVRPHRDADRGVPATELFDDQRVRDVIEAGAAEELCRGDASVGITMW